MTDGRQVLPPDVLRNSCKGMYDEAEKRMHEVMQDLNNQANGSFEEEDYTTAIQKYDQALRLHKVWQSMNTVYYNNESLSHLLVPPSQSQRNQSFLIQRIALLRAAEVQRARRLALFRAAEVQRARSRITRGQGRISRNYKRPGPHPKHLAVLGVLGDLGDLRQPSLHRCASSC